jgi:asparagine synthase (glutamine-hydrolysing)
MAGIAGLSSSGAKKQVGQMLDRITHRGKAGCKIVENGGVTLGAVWSEAEVLPTPPTLQQRAAWDASSPPLPEPSALGRQAGPFALAATKREGLFLARDPLGVRPLYYGETNDGTLYFASEVKALLEVINDVREFPPGCWYSCQEGVQPFARMGRVPNLDEDADHVASGLRLRLEQAVCRRIDQSVMGCWLSGGLDSSAIAALARPHVAELHSFAAGLPGAPDLVFAQQVARYLGTEHHEVIVTLDDLLAALPKTIYHLESFDALLVRSSITNYLVARQASDYVESVFSGEGSDELFAGYTYLKDLAFDQLADELVDIMQRLHNTALQRVNRSASAFGILAHVPFLDLEVVDWALRIPPEHKLRRNGQTVEKWILRQALNGALPDNVLWRPKAKFWQGAGVGDLLAEYAEEQITEQEFNRERDLPNGWALNTKEELMYYRLFRERFGEMESFSWMGRTKGAPIHPEEEDRCQAQ